MKQTFKEKLYKFLNVGIKENYPHKHYWIEYGNVDTASWACKICQMSFEEYKMNGGE